MNRRPPNASGALDEAYCLGHAAAMRADPDTACGYRASTKVAHWRRGWKDGNAQREAQTVTLTPDRMAKGRGHLADLRVYLGDRR